MCVQETRSVITKYAVAVTLIGFCATWLAAQPSQPDSTQNPPTRWVDPDTGMQVTRLTGEPGSRALYFNQNAFTPDGKRMIYLADKSLYVLTFAEYNSTRLLVQGPVETVVVGRKNPTVYFTKVGDRGFYAVSVTSGQTLKILDLPPNARITTLNADETIAAGTLLEEDAASPGKRDIDPSLRDAPLTEGQMTARLSARLPMELFTLDLRTAAVKTLLRSSDWFDEVMFSPTDPTLLMYLHQGPWTNVDRIWTIRSDGTQNALVHKRILLREAAGNAFWDNDGNTIWYDLQSPLGETFYLASYNVKTGQRMRYPIERDNWSIHYNVATDDKLFCGDGSDPVGPAAALDGKWIELFAPKVRDTPSDPSKQNLIQTGSLQPWHLVNLSKQKYGVEPNARFSPDHKLVIFTSNMFGPSYLFAVGTDVDPTHSVSLIYNVGGAEVKGK